MLYNLFKIIIFCFEHFISIDFSKIAIEFITILLMENEINYLQLYNN